MITFRSKHALMVIILLAVVAFLFSLWAILYEDQWLQTILAVYGILIILDLVLVFLSSKKKLADFKHVVKEFEKTLEGKLHHFKCPSCNGIFAVKKSKRNNKKSFMLTCPDCGNVGRIPPKPKSVEGEIPEEKSVTTRFTCKNCGEYISIWAEGTDLFHDMRIYSCPYCGKEQSMTT